MMFSSLVWCGHIRLIVRLFKDYAAYIFKIMDYNYAFAGGH